MTPTARVRSGASPARPRRVPGVAVLRAPGVAVVPTLVLLRHGESAWNSRDLFTGWVDVDLTASGANQARESGRRLREVSLLPDVLHTSVLTRAVRTGAFALEAADRPWIPVRRHWRLNERCYGALQGLDRTAVRQR